MKFSILIPAFKAKFLKECIISILNQTYRDFEIIIVNDASPENLTSIVQSFNDTRIRYYINKENCGAINVVDNWNKCLSYAKGDYILCMGDDDKLLPICLEEYVNLINKFPKLGLYHSWTEIIDENSNIVMMQEPRPIYESVYSMMWCRWNGRLQYIGDFLFDRKILIANGGFYKLPLAWGADDISSYIAACNTGVANMQVPGFQYRISNRTISNTGNSEIKLKAIELEEKWYKSFLSHKPTNDIDCIFANMLNKKLKKMIIKKIISTIVADLANGNMTKIIKYYKYKKKYHLNFFMIGYIFIEVLKHKKYNKYYN